MYKDHWLVGREDGFVSSWPKDYQTELKVADIFIASKKEWDMKMLRNLFWEDEINCINAIPLSPGCVDMRGCGNIN